MGVYIKDRKEPKGPDGGFRKPLNKDELHMLKRKLNMQQSAPFSKCPAKSKAALARLDAAGETHHRDKKHAPCEKCTCPYTAGHGTNHYGWGYCHHHERSRGKKESEQMARLDLEAHTTRHPRYFRNAQQFLERIDKDGQAAKEAFGLTNELGKARTIANDLHNNLASYMSRKRDTVTNSEVILKTIAAEVATNSSFTEHEKLVLGEQLIKIEERLRCPFTEKGQGGPVEASDTTVAKLMLDSFEQLSRISERAQKLASVDMITKEAFVEWLAEFLSRLKKEFGAQTYARNDGDWGIIEGIGLCAKDTGEPRRGI